MLPKEKSEIPQGLKPSFREVNIAALKRHPTQNLYTCASKSCVIHNVCIQNLPPKNCVHTCVIQKVRDPKYRRGRLVVRRTSLDVAEPLQTLLNELLGSGIALIGREHLV